MESQKSKTVIKYIKKTFYFFIRIYQRKELNKKFNY